MNRNMARPVGPAVWHGFTPCPWCGIPDNEHTDTSTCEAMATASQRLMLAWSRDADAAPASWRLTWPQRFALARVAVLQAAHKDGRGGAA